MKKYIYIGIMALSLASCSDFLDELPDNRIELTKESLISKLLVSAYPSTHNALIGEFYSDNVEENNRAYTYWQKLEEDIFRLEDTYEENQDSPTALWQDCYASIASANTALQKIAEYGDPASLSAQKGEALICRAYAHFLLATIFCEVYDPETADQYMGIPYITEPSTDIYPPSDRGTLAETYAAIEKDLVAALPLIRDDAYSVIKYHFNQKAAYAFAARFYMYYRQLDGSNYKKVIEYADRVLGTGDVTSVLRDWHYLGTLNANNPNSTTLAPQSSEYISAAEDANLLLQSCSSCGGCIDPAWTMSMRYAHNGVTAKEDCESTGLWGGYSSFYQQPFSTTGSPKKGFRRITLIQKVAISGESFYPYAVYPVFTTDETLLTRAEAYTLLKDYDAATSDIAAWIHNFTSSNAEVTQERIQDFYGSMDYWDPYETQNVSVKKRLSPNFTLDNEQENFIHCILHCRRVLTLGEGLRWQDIRRYGITVYRRYFEGDQLQQILDVMDKNDLRRVVQIPRTAIIAGVEANPR